MGWAGGGQLFGDLAAALQKAFPKNADGRRAFYREAYELFVAEDCDTIEDECYDIDPALDDVLNEKNPEEDEPEDEEDDLFDDDEDAEYFEDSED